ncbi:hypothetical protein [Lysobacter panacisoli]|uniref:DUF4279 domain-containing protein n=1 Tax=Lysobacter panacisoli TaxID=1255263 RepID=A0ABP9L222_9GAMM|nr:hypothetical protein [Lysobacter panacisoli]
MNPYRYRVTLRAIHPRDDIRPLFDQLGLTPERAWRAGEPRRTPKGTPLDGQYRESYAYTNLTSGSRNWSDEDLQDYLRGVQQRLAMHRETLQTFFVRGGRCGLVIGLSGESNFGFELDPSLSAGLADLKLTLGFDINPGPD